MDAKLMGIADLPITVWGGRRRSRILEFHPRLTSIRGGAAPSEESTRNVFPSEAHEYRLRIEADAPDLLHSALNLVF
jgi:hypothetical protein